MMLGTSLMTQLPQTLALIVMVSSKESAALHTVKCKTPVSAGFFNKLAKELSPPHPSQYLEISGYLCGFHINCLKLSALLKELKHFKTN